MKQQLFFYAVTLILCLSGSTWAYRYQVYSDPLWDGIEHYTMQCGDSGIYPVTIQAWQPNDFNMIFYINETSTRVDPCHFTVWYDSNISETYTLFLHQSKGSVCDSSKCSPCIFSGPTAHFEWNCSTTFHPKRIIRMDNLGPDSNSGGCITPPQKC
mmetsp:Transcript_15730/g.17479  ORF Transcript_15730/g.17479 Transcript_15730/m.17479 type:complete len:156 (+) Transcript_15730:34-501(+)